MTNTTNSLLDAPLRAPPPPSELDEIMSRNPLDLAAQDIDKVIAFQRTMRARREAPKGKAKAQLTDGSGMNLAEMMKAAAIPRAQMEAAIGPAKPAPVVKPAAGFRRI